MDARVPSDTVYFVSVQEGNRRRTSWFKSERIASAVANAAGGGKSLVFFGEYRLVRRLDGEVQAARLAKALDDIRDAILNGSGPLESCDVDPDVISAVLDLIDSHDPRNHQEPAEEDHGRDGD